MKKFVIVVFACIFTSLSANAKTLKGKVIGEISTYYPKETIKIEVTKSVMIKNTEFKKGYVVTGTMTDVKSPDKGQNEASFVFTINKCKFTDLCDMYKILLKIKRTNSTTIKDYDKFIKMVIG